jgi:hypothetical protein
LPRQPFGKEAEAFEHGAVVELIGESEKLFRGRILTLEIAAEALRNMPDAAADCRIVQHVDDGFSRAGHVDPD